MRIFMLLLSCLTASGVAQNYIVSPNSFANTEGSSQNVYPWYTTFRYAQIHGDLRGTPRLLRSLAWRRDGYDPSTASVPRTLNLELRIADSSHASASTVYANNYLNPPVTAVARRNVNLPDWVARQGTPAPFSYTINMDAPVAYSGTQDLLWEVSIFSSTAPSVIYSTDAFSTPPTNQASWLATASTCTVTGRPRPLNAWPIFIANVLTNTMSLSWSCDDLQANAPAAFMVGVSDPSLVIPGLCNKLYVNPAFTLSGTADSTGRLTVGPFVFPFNPTWVGVPIYGQAVAADPGQSGLPFVVSNGTRCAPPDLPPLPLPILRLWTFGGPTAPNGEIGLGYGLVTRFEF